MDTPYQNRPAMNYQALFDTLPDPLLLLNNQLQVTMCNEASEEYLGSDKEQLCGATLDQLLSNTALAQRVNAALHRRESAVVEFPLAGTQGKLQMARAHVSPLEEGPDEIHCLLRLEDISEQSLLEQKLARAEKRAEELRLLARSMAHEIGNPLSIMRSTLHYIDGMLPGAAPESLAEPIEMLDNMVTQIDELLQLLSDFASSQKSQNKIIDMRYLIRKTHSLFEREAAERGILLEHHEQDELPLYEGNPSAIRAMLINLVKNAMEAVTEGGKVNINAYAPPNTGAKSLCIEVTDSGPGLSQQNIALIFKPFYSSKATGQGLGLSFCKRVIEEHGGEIMVESEPGAGATFKVILPYDIPRELA
jgi:PAS domain S-box-containing protein